MRQSLWYMAKFIDSTLKFVPNRIDQVSNEWMIDLFYYINLYHRISRQKKKEKKRNPC